MKEDSFIKDLIHRYKKTFPKSDYMYQQMGDTHFLRVIPSGSFDSDRFVSFCIDEYDAFYAEGYENLLCITDEDLLVEFDNLESVSTFATRIPVNYVSNNEVIDKDMDSMLLAA